MWSRFRLSIHLQRYRDLANLIIATLQSDADAVGKDVRGSLIKLLKSIIKNG